MWSLVMTRLWRLLRLVHMFILVEIALLGEHDIHVDKLMVPRPPVDISPATYRDGLQ